MTISNFQSNLKNEMERIFSGLRLKRPDGSYAPMSIFEQDLPVPQENDEADASVVNMPYLIVRIASGKVVSWNDPIIIQALIVCCVWDNSLDRQGYKDCLIIINRILERFQKSPNLGNFMSTGKIEWAVNEEDTHPYYLGAVQMDFEAPKFVKEDPLT